jgi:hypothetical protein
LGRTWQAEELKMGIFGDMFGQSHQFYEQLDPQQQQVVGQQFQQEFAQSQDPYVQQQGWDRLDPSQLDSRQLGQMHDYAQQRDPSILSRVMDHPVLDAALVGLGVHEWKKHEER